MAQDAETPRCSQCGSVLPEGTVVACCTRCVFESLFSNNLDGPGEDVLVLRDIDEGGPKLKRFGDYEVLGELGRGGMGVVYRARQLSLNRLVAVKMILAGSLAGEREVKRFLAEAEAVAHLDHPNIVPVFEVGQHEGNHFYSMKFIEGEDLAVQLGAGKWEGAEGKRVALLLTKVARAVHHGHQHGILHRDLKPANIVLNAEDEPHITDFGLARKIESESAFTLSGSILGTPDYMAPEQARGNSGVISTAADVFSLGSIFYHLLTGHPPFHARTSLETLHRVVDEEPTAPRDLRSTLDQDLETICLKCLEKDPAHRYSSAQAVADELDRWLKGEPILARPATPATRLVKWVRRKPIVASLVFALNVIGLAGAVGILAEWRRAVSERAEAQHSVYVADLNLIQEAWEQNNVSQVRQLLEETASSSWRGYEWYYWQRQTHRELRSLRGHFYSVSSVAWSPDGRLIVTGSDDRLAKLWQADTGRELLTLKGHTAQINSVAFSPDSRRVVTGGRDHIAKVWDAINGKELLTFKGQGAEIWSAVFSPDGQRIISVGGEATAKIWEAGSGRELASLQGHTGAVSSAAFSPDGRWVVTTGADHTARIWDATNGHEIACLTGHAGAVWSASFSPDNRRVVTGSDDQSAIIWEWQTGKPLLTLHGSHRSISSVAWSPDGHWIVTAGDDGLAKVWQADTGKEWLTLQGHASGINSAAFSPNSMRIVTGSADREAKIWELAGNENSLAFPQQSNSLNAVAFSPEGGRILTAAGDTPIVWAAGSGHTLLTLHGHTDTVWSAAFSPDGQRIVTGSGDLTAELWNAVTGEEIMGFKGHNAAVLSAAFSPDGRRIVTGSGDRTAKVWEADSGKLLATLQGHAAAIRSTSFSPDGSRIVTAGDDARIWEAGNGRLLVTFLGHNNPIRSASFSPDGRVIVTASEDETAKIWLSRNGKELHTLRGHVGPVNCTAFSPDGLRLVTGGTDETARLWDVASGKELLTLRGDAGPISSVAFSPDGRRIVGGCGDGSVRMWEAASAGQVTLLQQEDQASADHLQALQNDQDTESEDVATRQATDPGAIKEWLALAPISFDGRSSAAAIEALDEEQLPGEANLHPQPGERVKVGQNQRVWTALNLDDYLLDFNQYLGVTTPWSVGYAVCYIQSETNRTGLLLKVGSDDESKVYLNGKEVYRRGGGRTYVPDQDTVSGIELKAGINRLVFKVVNETLDWNGSVRFTDTNGRRIEGIHVLLTPP